jgi:hypothetical protein
MRTSLIQLGLKGLHSHQFIQVRKSRHREGSLEAVVDQDQVLLVLPLSLPPHLSSTSAICELSAYLDSDRVTAYEDNFDLLLWWHDHKLTYLILSIMARDIMSVPVSTISFESCFSLTGMILEERRRCWLTENVEMLACIKDRELGARREHHDANSPELEEAFKNMYLDEEEGSGGSETGDASGT